MTPIQYTQIGCESTRCGRCNSFLTLVRAATWLPAFYVCFVCRSIVQQGVGRIPIEGNSDGSAVK